ncbi:MAG: hypothetical protein ACFFD4_29280 [Candidatus Odinarchaeota archaeon]
MSLFVRIYRSSILSLNPKILLSLCPADSTNQTDFKVEMDPTSLSAVGSPVSVVFCRKAIPSEVASFKYGENMELEYVVQLELTVQVVA